MILKIFFKSLNCHVPDKESFLIKYITLILLIEAITIRKLKPKLNHQLGPYKKSSITLNIFK